MKPNRSTKFWDRASRTMERRSPSSYQTFQETLVRIQPYLEPGDRVLDFACGAGGFAAAISPLVAEIQALDSSPGMVQRTEERIKSGRISNLAVRLSELEDEFYQPASFDRILALNILHLVPDPKEKLTRMVALLKPGGTLLSATACLGQGGGSLAWVINLFSKIGLVPKVTPFSRAALEEMICDAGLLILETSPVGVGAPQVFIAASKPDTESYT